MAKTDGTQTKAAENAAPAPVYNPPTTGNAWADAATAMTAAGWTDGPNGWQPAATGAPQAPTANNVAAGVVGIPVDASGNPWGGDPTQGKAIDSANVPLSQQETDAMAYYQKNPAFQQYVAQNFASIAWMLQVPELLSVMVGAAANNWSQQTLNAALGQTDWWKTNSSAVKQFQNLQGSDPASAAQQVAAQKAILQQSAAGMGIQMTDSQLTQMATTAAEFQWNSAQMNVNLQAAYRYPTGSGQNIGDAATMQQTVKNVAGNYLVTADDNMQNFWTTAAMHKGQTATQLQAEMQNYYGQQAAVRFPWMKTAIEQGLTPKDYLAPYTTQAATTLAVAPDSIDWSQPKWQHALLQNVNGVQTPLNSDQFNKKLMQDPQFNYNKTQNAINQAYATSKTIESTFGRVAV